MLEEIQLQDKAGLAPTGSLHLYKPALEVPVKPPHIVKEGEGLLRNLLEPTNRGRVSGVGIAFSQLALASKGNYRMFSMFTGLPDIRRANIGKGKLTVYSNASYEPVTSAGRTKRLESCLSAAGLLCEVWRWNEILARFAGQEEPVLLTGTDAWIFQHETDHNNGMLCHDRAFSQGLSVHYTPPELIQDFPSSSPHTWKYPVASSFWKALKTGKFDFRRKPRM